MLTLWVMNKTFIEEYVRRFPRPVFHEADRVHLRLLNIRSISTGVKLVIFFARHLVQYNLETTGKVDFRFPFNRLSYQPVFCL